MKLLLVGIPGTSKTTLGNYLRDHRGFVHIDMEIGTISQDAYNNPVGFVNTLDNAADNLIVTWGFPPIQIFVDIIFQLKNKKFSVVWLGGNREFAKKVFVERETRKGPVVLKNSLNNWERQIKAIDDTGVINLIAPKIVDPFNSDGSFKSYEERIQDILS